MILKTIAAVSSNNIIGVDGKIPWHCTDDLKRFKSLTEGSIVVMGRKTWDSLPDSFRPLPERVNIVMSRDTGWSHADADVALYPGRAIEIAYAEACDECWVIGGAQIYAMFLDQVEEIHVTTVHTSDSGDVKFPEWDRSGWAETVVETLEGDVDNVYATTYSIWKKS